MISVCAELCLYCNHINKNSFYGANKLLVSLWSSYAKKSYNFHNYSELNAEIREKRLNLE